MRFSPTTAHSCSVITVPGLRVGNSNAVGVLDAVVANKYTLRVTCRSVFAVIGLWKEISKVVLQPAG